jgi:hypothetical protein
MDVLTAAFVGGSWRWNVLLNASKNAITTFESKTRICVLRGGGGGGQPASRPAEGMFCDTLMDSGAAGAARTMNEWTEQGQNGVYINTLARQPEYNK